MTAAEHREILAAFEKALDRERHNLERWPELFWQQLHNRLQWSQGPARELVGAELDRRAADADRPIWFRTWTPFREAEALLRTLRHEGVQACAFAPDGARLSSVGDSVRLWDARTGVELGRVSEPDGFVVSCAFDCGGDLLVTGSHAGTVRIRDARTLTELVELRAEAKEAHCATSPVEPVAVVASGATLRLVELPSGRELVSSSMEDGAFSCCTFSVGDLIVTGDDEGTLRFWSWSLSSLDERRRVTHAHAGPVRGCEVSADYAFLATAGDDAVKVWGFADDGEIQVFSLRQFAQVNDCAISPDNQLLVSVSADRTAWVRRVHDWKAPISVLEGHSAPVIGCAFPAHGSMLATAGEDGTVRLWDPSRPRSLGGVAGHRDRITALAFAPDGSFVVSASADMTLKTWDPAPTAERRTFEGHLAPVWDCVVLKGSSLIASAAGDGTIRLWDAGSGRQTRVLDVGDDVHALAYSPDGYLLAAGHGDSISLWDIATGERTGEADVGGGRRAEWVQDCAFTPNGDRLLVACEDECLGCHEPTEMLRFRCPHCGSELFDVAFTGGHDLVEIMWGRQQLSQQHVDQGGRLFQQGLADEALKEFQQAIVANPWNATAHGNIGVIFLRRDQPGEALQWFERALEIDPNVPGAREMAERARRQLG